MATIKLFADGALGSGGAHLLDAYKEGGHGLAMYEPDALADEVAARMEDGWQVAVHAIGDAAARDVLDAFAGVDGARRRQLRPRLEHAQMLADRDCRRLGELSTIASIQPIHLRSDATWADQVLSDEQLDRLYPWPALAEHATLAAGSDYPIADCNPWHGIATAVTRRVETDADQGGHGRPFFGHKALTRRQILAAYTCGAATAAGWESTLGRLDKGFVADVIALEHDPFEASADQLWGMDVLQVWMGGRAML